MANETKCDRCQRYIKQGNRSYIIKLPIIGVANSHTGYDLCCECAAMVRRYVLEPNSDEVK